MMEESPKASRRDDGRVPGVLSPRASLLEHLNRCSPSQPPPRPTTCRRQSDCSPPARWASEPPSRPCTGSSARLAYGLALRVLRDEHLAQDALQEAFTQVWTDSGRFDPTCGSARAWIMTLVHRRAVDRVRRDQADRQRGHAWGAGQVDVDHDSVAEIVELRAEHRRVRSALAALTPLQRQALELAYQRGLTQTQIAAHLGIPLGTAKTRLRDALQRLRTEMEVPAMTNPVERPDRRAPRPPARIPPRCPRPRRGRALHHAPAHLRAVPHRARRAVAHGRGPRRCPPRRAARPGRGPTDGLPVR